VSSHVKPLMCRRMGVLVVAILLAIGGCTSPQPKPAKVDTQAVTNAEAKAYFENLGSDKPDRLEEALKTSADDSIAMAYVSHRLALANAAIDDGTPYEAGSVTREGEGFEYCATADDPSSCYVWADIRSQNGKISSFTVDGEELGPRLSVGSGTPAKAGKVGSVELLTAYQSVTGDSLFVTMLVRSADEDISIGHLSAKYRDPDGRQSEASDSIGPSDLEADSTAHVVAIFEGAKPGGRVTFDLDTADYAKTATVKLKTR
jgi:hypothetical protein